MLSLDASIPCGLIVNEIISNSLKYAFPDNRDGIIFVTLRVNKNKVHIDVGDNGIGISESVDVKNTQTLGLQLVDTLVEQLNGTFNIIRKNGTIFSIEFNI
jgi:two-component sensor histidine kinase